MAQITVDTVLHLRDFGLEWHEEDQAIVGFAQKAEAKLVRWIDFAKRALLFLMVPGDSESGMFYIYNRGRSSLYLALATDRAPLRRFSEKEFESLTEAFGLVALTRNPRVLRT